jgi:hypothetical protein
MPHRQGGYVPLDMSTNVKPLQGRHRAPVDARPALSPGALRALAGALAAVVVVLAALWQVL